MQVTQENTTTHSDEGIELPGPIELSHMFVQSCVRRGDVVVDATVGNGSDTLFLADLVGADGIVYGFDVQEDALSYTQDRLLRAGFERRVRLIHASHDSMAQVVDPYHHGRVSAAVFNLGYRPGGGKNIVTQPESTVAALDQCLSVVAPDGIIAVVVYPGHIGGKDECAAVVEWSRRLEMSRFLVTSYGFVNRPKSPPFALFVQVRG